MVHEKGTVDVAAKLKQKVDITAGGPGTISLKQLGEKSLTLQTSAGPKNYTLHQYALKYETTGLDTTTGSQYTDVATEEKTKLGTTTEGQEFAYLPLANSYIYINGFCKTPDQLPKAIPALEAVTYSPAN